MLGAGEGTEGTGQLRRWLFNLARYFSCLTCFLFLSSTCIEGHASEVLLPDIDGYYNKRCVDAACHPVEAKGNIPMHLPYLEGQCLTCHVDHLSTTTGLLQSQFESMCQNCHTELKPNMERGRLRHPPGNDACMQCHAPHKSRVRNLLRDDKALLICVKCHEAFLREAKSRPYSHRYFDPETECGYCHYAHHRRANKYLRESVAESCLTCHDLPIRVNGRSLENVGKRMREASVVHEAMQGESCPACHTPHGSDQPSLLKPGYPAGSYQIYRTEQYTLCWQCHDPALVESIEGEDVTQFRDGAMNLHRVHVVQLRRGRACHLCHEPHASDQPHLQRQRVLFGKWDAPLVYESLPDGGRCQTPCHRVKEYRRKSRKPH